jgi:hypothetical protein
MYQSIHANQDTCSCGTILEIVNPVAVVVSFFDTHEVIVVYGLQIGDCIPTRLMAGASFFLELVFDKSIRSNTMKEMYQIETTEVFETWVQALDKRTRIRMVSRLAKLATGLWG